MKSLHILLITFACLIVSLPMIAFGLGGDYEPGKSISLPDTWPPRLVTIVKQPSRVAGFFVNQDDYLAFRGGTAEFRAFLDICASLGAFAPTTLHVHPGRGSFQALDKAKAPVPCDWQLDVINLRWRASDPNPKGPAYSMNLHVWLESSMDISAVEIPSTVKTIKEIDPKETAAHPTAGVASEAPLLNNRSEGWGEATSGLEMSVLSVRSPWSSSEDPEFQVGFRNVGDKDTFLNLGVTLANGLRHFPDAISLTLIDPEGRSHQLQPFDLAGVAGRVDDYAVGLQVGAVHFLQVRLSRFRFEHAGEEKISLRAGRYKVSAQIEGHAALRKNTGMDWTAWNFWEGTQNSNAASFDVRD